MSQSTSVEPAIAPEDSDRALLYGFVGRLLQAAPDAADLTVLSKISSDPEDTSPIGNALRSLTALAEEVTSEDVLREYHDLFIGVGRGELVPFGSYYLTGFLNEKPLADLRVSMSNLGIERAEGVNEPEDHIAALLQMMEGLIQGDFGHEVPLSLCEQRSFFNDHLAKWAPHFFKDLAAQDTSRFYAAVGVLGQAVIDVETEAFEMIG
ncbi:cytoplasmic chaperone TorD [Roseibium sp. TrichSKD4]|uniref:TorD/DmsD family molecular chaperone n=1 Tax=Roseibium sp. TrichSKD4 TaxID=744980 RepID=UPI0001E57009|nr:molecular chaperone TorD family protein [Roseibium sp. TrichSKD4]EFO30424.1 cytoplasmic chaperone TorD [Roseibium sp. TrichSKD4]